MDINEFSKYAFLWDGSEPGWRLAQHDEDWTTLVLEFAEGGPTVAEIQAIRAVFPGYGAQSPSVTLGELKGRRKVQMGEFDGIEGRQLHEACKGHGLQVRIEGGVRASYSFVNSRSNGAFVIEDDELAALVAREAERRGLPVDLSTT